MVYGFAYRGAGSPIVTQKEPHQLPGDPHGARTAERQRLGFKLIITYKFCKAALMFGVALWLTIAPGAAYRTLERVARELAEGGAVFGRAGHWIQHHLTNSMVFRGAILAWLDGVSSALEGFLLWSGKAWAEWIVILGLACLLPFEIASILHHPGVVKFFVLGVNIAIVAYLVRARLHQPRI
jgi:uncharacterized membrane protein (DUF2068 family)